MSKVLIYSIFIERVWGSMHTDNSSDTESQSKAELAFEFAQSTVSSHSDYHLNYPIVPL